MHCPRGKLYLQILSRSSIGSSEKGVKAFSFSSICSRDVTWLATAVKASGSEAVSSVLSMFEEDAIIQDWEFLLSDFPLLFLRWNHMSYLEGSERSGKLEYGIKVIADQELYSKVTSSDSILKVSMRKINRGR
jgi:hypothetical protein